MKFKHNCLFRAIFVQTSNSLEENKRGAKGDKSRGLWVGRRTTFA